MSRIRTIKPEFWTSAQIMECSPIVRLFFIGLWNFCDDHGRHGVSEKQLKALIFPADDFTAENIRGMIEELAANDLIILYHVDNKEYLQVTGWGHQRIDKPQKSKLPGPERADQGSFDDHYENGRLRKGEERKGEEKKERILSISQKGNDELAKASANSHSPSAPPKAEIDRKADEFYAAYPKKVDPKAAKAKFASACRAGVAPDRIIEAASRFAESHRVAGTDKQFIPAPSVWLNRGGYDSEDLPRARAPPPRWETPYTDDA